MAGAELIEYPSHRTFEMYGVAARAAGLPIELFSYTEHERPGGVSGRPKNIVDPWIAAGTARRRGGVDRVLILREFLTLPLLFAAPAYRSIRRRTWLVSVHNLQRARERMLDRAALRALVRYGFRLILPESAAGSELLRLHDRSSVTVLPLGVTEAQAQAPRGPKEEGCIALVGRARAEKRIGERLDQVAKATRQLAVKARLVVGTDDQRLLEAAANGGIETVDTTSENAYRQVLARSQVVVLTYDRADYELRTSGVVLDAAAACAAVVTPDFPVLRDQIRNPVEIGVTCGDEREMAPALSRAMKIAEVGAPRFDAYLEARSARALAVELDKLVAPAVQGGERR